MSVSPILTFITHTCHTAHRGSETGKTGSVRRAYGISVDEREKVKRRCSLIMTPHIPMMYVMSERDE